MSDTKQVTLGEVLVQMSHARRRMSTTKGDRETLSIAMDIMTQMAQRITELEAEKTAVNLRAREAEVASGRLVLTDA